LSLPRADEDWLLGFSQGLFELADAHACELIGGDTTQGPLNIAITVLGETPHGQAILRNTAQVGDDIYVSGHLGDARLALEVFRGTLSLPQAAFELARARMETPTPRTELGMSLRGLATAMADISDGLLGDLGHILQASGVGARLDLLAISRRLLTREAWDCPREWMLRCVLTGGDDYELVFTAPQAARQALDAVALNCNTPVTRIGSITLDRAVLLVQENGDVLPNTFRAFDHFA